MKKLSAVLAATLIISTMATSASAYNAPAATASETATASVGVAPYAKYKSSYRFIAMYTGAYATFRYNSSLDRVTGTYKFSGAEVEFDDPRGVENPTITFVSNGVEAYLNYKIGGNSVRVKFMLNPYTGQVDRHN